MYFPISNLQSVLVALNTRRCQILSHSHLMNTEGARSNEFLHLGSENCVDGKDSPNGTRIFDDN